MEEIEKVAHKLHLESFTGLEYIRTVADKTKQKPIIIAFAHFVIIVLLLLFTKVGRVILESSLLFFYPAYKSFHALQTETTYDDRRWLTYWVVFGFIYGFDSSLSFIFNRIPFWPIIRIFVLLFVMHPLHKGAETIYQKGIRPVLDKYDEQIDKYLGNAEAKLESFGNKAKKAAADTISKNLLKTD
jgi:receptor expression-enhancing protein 5/6